MSGFDRWLPDIHARPEDWIAPIVRSGEADLALELISNSPALLHLRVNANYTLLHEAAFFGHQELADRLIALGADLDIVSAVALGRTEVVRLMLKNSPRLLRKHSPEGIGLLHIACRNAGSEMISFLLMKGLEVNDSGNRKRLTPLFFADVPNAELLLSKGANINARAKHGFTALHRAARYGDAEMAGFLVERGARTDLQTDGRQTAWALAMRRGRRDIAALLRG